jgi:predicted DNA-binding transcriptional regulator AlpA
MENARAKWLIRDKEAAGLIGCSRATFWRRVRDGTFPPPIRIGGLTRWPKTEIEAVIESALSNRSLNGKPRKRGGTRN